MSVACCLITSADYKRATLLDDVIVPKVREQAFDEVLVVGEHHDGAGYRYVHVPSLTRTTIDALVKRDVAALAAAKHDVLWYLSDDHYPKMAHRDWMASYWQWDVIVPMRWTFRDGVRIALNNGEQEQYCGGHGMIVRRWVVEALPWTAGPHHANWDLLMSRRQQALGAEFRYGTPGLDIYDVEGGEPWR